MIYVIDARKLRRIMRQQGINSVVDLGARIGKSKQALYDSIFKAEYNIIKSNVQDVAAYLDIDPLEIIEKK